MKIPDGVARWGLRRDGTADPHPRPALRSDLGFRIAAFQACRPQHDNKNMYKNFVFILT